MITLVLAAALLAHPASEVNAPEPAPVPAKLTWLQVANTVEPAAPFAGRWIKLDASRSRYVIGWPEGRFFHWRAIDNPGEPVIRDRDSAPEPPAVPSPRSAMIGDVTAELANGIQMEHSHAPGRILGSDPDAIAEAKAAQRKIETRRNPAQPSCPDCERRKHQDEDEDDVGEPWIRWPDGNTWAVLGVLSVLIGLGLIAGLVIKPPNPPSLRPL